jgi:hypothetical protein
VTKGTVSPLPDYNVVVLYGELAAACFGPTPLWLVPTKKARGDPGTGVGLESITRNRAIGSDVRRVIQSSASIRLAIVDFDVRDAATLCLKLSDEQTQRRHRNSAAIDPFRMSAMPKMTPPLSLSILGVVSNAHKMRILKLDEVDS